MKSRPNKSTKDEMRKKGRLTRPPRLEGKVKEAMMQPVRKPGRRRRSESLRKHLRKTHRPAAKAKKV